MSHDTASFLVMWLLSPLEDLGRVLGDAVARSRVGRGEVSSANSQNKWPLGCSLTALTLVSGGRAQSQATALQMLKATRQGLRECFLLQCFCHWILEWQMMLEPVPPRLSFLSNGWPQCLGYSGINSFGYRHRRKKPFARAL